MEIRSDCGANAIPERGAPGMIRTCDTGFRRAVLYPLSYGGNDRWELTWLTDPGRNSGGASYDKSVKTYINIPRPPVASQPWS